MSTENEDLLDDGESLVSDDELEVVVEDTDDDEGEEDTLTAEESEADPVEADDEEEVAAEESEVEDNTPKGRWAREKRLRERIITERDTIARERDEVKHAAIQVATIAQQHEIDLKQRDEEVVALRRQNATLQKHFAESLDYAYERDITLNSQKLRKAREDGNYDEELAIQGAIDKLRFEQNQIRQAKSTLPDPNSVQAPQRTPPQQAQKQVQQQIQQQIQQQQKPPPPQRAVQWLQNNQTWFGHPSYEGHRAFTLAEDMKLVREGYDKQSAEYYRELDRRIDKAFPGLRKKRAVRGPVGPATSSGQSTSRRTVSLNKTDLKNMRNFGLDPSNKEHLREYARSKRTA